MKSLDITKLYGIKWYLYAHYSEPHLLHRHCTTIELSDAMSGSNPAEGSDVCRVSNHRVSVEFYDGEVRERDYFFMIPNTTDQSAWINTYGMSLFL